MRLKFEDLSLEARIWTSRLGFGPQGGGMEKKEKEKYPICEKALVIGPFGAAAQILGKIDLIF